MGKKTHSGAIAFQTPLQPLLGTPEVYGPVDLGLCFHCLEPRFNSWGWETERSQKPHGQKNKQTEILAKTPFPKKESTSLAQQAMLSHLNLCYFTFLMLAFILASENCFFLTVKCCGVFFTNQFK